MTVRFAGIDCVISFGRSVPFTHRQPRLLFLVFFEWDLTAVAVAVNPLVGLNFRVLAVEEGLGLALGVMRDKWVFGGLGMGRWLFRAFKTPFGPRQELEEKSWFLCFDKNNYAQTTRRDTRNEMVQAIRYTTINPQQGGH